MGDILKGRVERVIDGDTFRLNGQPIRLWGFNTPERYQKNYFAAAALLESLVIDQIVQCRIVDRDRYSRIVAQCRVNQKDIGIDMVSSGLAVDYTRYSKGYYKKYQPQHTASLSSKFAQ